MSDPMKLHRARRLAEYLSSLVLEDDTEQRRTFMLKTGYSKGRVTQLLHEGFGERAAISIATKLRLRDKRWFEQPVGTAPDSEPSTDDTRTPGTGTADTVAAGFVRIPLMHEALANEPGEPEPLRHVDVLASWVQHALRTEPQQLRVLMMQTPCLTGLVEVGDLLFVQPCDELSVDGAYVIEVGESVCVRRLRRRISDRHLSIECTDGSAPEVVPVERIGESFTILGRVVGAWSLRRL